MIGDYQFTMKSVPDGINVTAEASPRVIQRVCFMDSVLKFFPYASIFIKDNTSVFADYFYFVEGLKINILLGNKDDGYMGHDFCWTEGQINNVKFANHIAGDYAFVLLSNYYMNNAPSTKASKGEISDIIKEVVTKGLKIPETKDVNGKKQPNHFISKTSNGPGEIWYQARKNHREFIEYLSTRAYSSSCSQQQSPIVTFINTNGEFYFSSLIDMYNEAPVKKFKIAMDNNMSTQSGFVKNYNTLNGGVSVNKKAYKSLVVAMPQTGTSSATTLDITNQYLKLNGNKSKLLIRKDYLNINQIIDFGLIEDTDSENIKGRYNNLYLNSNMSYRMTIVDSFDPKLVCGKTIELEVEKTSDESISPEFSGKWLIIESEVAMNCEAAPYCKLLLAKPSIDIVKEHPYYNDFV